MVDGSRSRGRASVWVVEAVLVRPEGMKFRGLYLERGVLADDGGSEDGCWDSLRRGWSAERTGQEAESDVSVFGGGKGVDLVSAVCMGQAGGGEASLEKGGCRSGRMEAGADGEVVAQNQPILRRESSLLQSVGVDAVELRMHRMCGIVKCTGVGDGDE